MYCDKVIELLKELERSREDTIPPYNNDGINQVLSEMNTLDAEIIDFLRKQKDNLPLDAIRLRRAAIERNKRCLLTYIWTRIQRLKKMRWEIGAILPSDVRQNLSQSEIEWFNNYCKSLVSYMKTIGPDTGLNLTQDTKPLKSLYTEVRSLVDAGKLELESGEVLILRKNSQYMLSRSQAEPLIRQGVLEQFPSTWKSAVNIPILKPSKPPDKADSYRPISLLPVLGKILEKLLLKRLLKISNEQNALPDFQFGFCPKHATFHQLHRVVDLIASSLETKKYFSAVFLDVSQAFDSVWHVLYKLKEIYPAPYYLLLKSYIENRFFNVKIESTFSDSYDVLVGVPQGSDIVPFLYISFTVDIPTTENSTVGTYADDTAIFAADSDPDICSHHLQNHLNMLSKWCNTWKIKVNEFKSTHITFTLRPKDCLEVSFNNSVIPQSREAKYLGLLLDRRLTSGPHIKNKRKQLNSHLHLIRPLLKSNMNLSYRLL
ncbi:hypothetical protein QTP88_017451 [Uroleucon formosanum]